MNNYPIDLISKGPKEFAVRSSIKDLVEFIEYARDKYYNGIEVISDKVFDILWDTLRERDPTNKIFEKVGAPIRDDVVKVNLPFFMPSLDKIKPNKDTLTKWIKKYNNNSYHISEKLDGLSGMITYSKDNKIKLYTRGNGDIGQDITFISSFINIPKRIVKHQILYNVSSNVSDIYLAVRGEFIIKKNIFDKKYSSNYPKIRSIVSGTINSKNPDKNILKDIDFVSYQIMYPKEIIHSNQLQALGDLGFEVVRYNTQSDLSIDILSKLLQKYKDKSIYPIDGIVVGDNSVPYSNKKNATPDHAFAFKMDMDDQRAETTVIQVNWNKSKHGRLAPQIQFEQIKIGGDIIEYTTGFNGKYILDNNIGKGTKLIIIKSGDVIPYIDSVIKSTKADMPSSKWTWDKNKVNIYIDNSDQDEEVNKARLKHFFTTLKIPNINVGIINKLVDSGYNTLNKLYNIDIENLLKVDGIQDKMANKIYNNIHQVLDNEIDLVSLMTASNAFGQGFGNKRLKPLILKYPKWDSISLDEILTIEGYSKLMANKYLAGLPIFDKFLKDNSFLKIKITKKNELLSNVSSNVLNNKLSGKLFVLSGFRDSKLESEIETRGGKVSNTISSKTTALIIKEAQATSSKIDKANKLNIDIILLESFKKKYL